MDKLNIKKFNEAEKFLTDEKNSDLEDDLIKKIDYELSYGNYCFINQLDNPEAYNYVLINERCNFYDCCRRKTLKLPEDATDEECEIKEKEIECKCRREKLKLSEDATDEECEIKEKEIECMCRREKLKLSEDATDEECEIKEKEIECKCRREKLKLPEDATDEECEIKEKEIEYKYRREKLNLPENASDLYCKVEENKIYKKKCKRRENLNLPEDATDEECYNTEKSIYYDKCKSSFYKDKFNKLGIKDKNTDENIILKYQIIYSKISKYLKLQKYDKCLEYINKLKEKYPTNNIINEYILSIKYNICFTFIDGNSPETIVKLINMFDIDLDELSTEDVKKQLRKIPLTRLAVKDITLPLEDEDGVWVYHFVDQETYDKSYEEYDLKNGYYEDEECTINKCMDIYYERDIFYELKNIIAKHKKESGDKINTEENNE